MKKVSVKELMAILLFFLIILASTLVLKPIYTAVSKGILLRVQKIENLLVEKTGISISYGSLSPSVFTGLRLKNIILTDSNNGNSIIEIKKATVRYSLIKFIKKEGLSALKDITVDGFTLEFDKDGTNEFLEKLKSLSKKQDLSKLDLQKSATQKNDSPKSDDLQEDNAQKILNTIKTVEEVISSLPIDVYVKNVKLLYKTADSSLEALLKRISFDFSEKSKTLSLKSFGTVLYQKRREEKSPLVVSGAFSAEGRIFENLEGSSVLLRLSSFTDGFYYLKPVNLVASYSNKIAEVRTIQNDFPLFASFSLPIKSGIANLSLHAKNLKVSSFVNVKKNTESFKKIKNLSLSFDSFFDYDMSLKKTRYGVSGNSFVPKTLFKDGFSLNFNANGTEKKVYVTKLSANGKNIDAEFSGDFAFEKKQLSGTLGINNFTLKDGGVVATEVYFDPQEKGFMAFAPQLMMDEKALTALQLSVIPTNDSYDFSFEVSDYSHIEAENAGTLSVNGSYIGGTKYVQANVSASSMFLDSLAGTAAFFAKGKHSSDFAMLSSYAFNGEFFVSSDFKNLSFNVPYAFAVNTKKDGQFILVSLDGNDKSVSVSQFDVVSGGKKTSLSALFERSPDSDEAFFMADINADSIPYHFNGTLMENTLSINGDYGVQIDVLADSKKGISGNVYAENLPLGLSNTIFTFLCDSSFSYTKQDGINVILQKFECREDGRKFSFAPVVFLSGEVSKYGAFMNEISYSDNFSSLDGSSELLWNINDSAFSSASLNFNIKNPLSSEAISITADISNPESLSLSAENIKKSFYLSAQGILNNVSLNRFSSEQSENNSLTATVIASGSLENPYVGLDISNLELMTAGKSILAHGEAYIEEKNLTAQKIDLKYNNVSVSNVEVLFNLNDFTGKISGSADAEVAKKTVHAPFVFSVSDTFIPEDSKIPQEFAANFTCPKISGTLLKKEFPFELTVIHASDATSIFTSAEQGLSATLTNDGNINLSIDSQKPVSLDAFGNIFGSDIELSVTNIKANLKELLSFVDIDRIKIYDGLLRGAVEISGMKSDPEFKGSLALTKADFSLPKIVKEHITIPRARFILNHNMCEMPQVQGMVRDKNPVFAKMNVYLDRWNFDRLEAKIWNPEKVYMPGDFEIRLAHFKGDANLNLDLVFQDSFLDVSGDVHVRKLTAAVKTQELANTPPKRNWFARTDVRIFFGQHVTFVFDPLLRAVLVPDTDFGFKYDMSQGAVELDGDLAFRSGDISYLSRNFYLKNGIMKFNSNDPTFNPLITVQAETRERDDNGNDVRIILSAVNQYLLDFNAQFSSIPAKSEAEIRNLLGQIAVGDSENVGNFLFAAGDYALQSTLGRSVENKLRDFLNFDILSVRTNVLQNALNYGLISRDENSENKNSSFGISNFFDNSTVYVGKYFGSSLYMDALMHWSYDETKVDDEFVANGLVFRPEFGLEVESPFGNIRWNMAPDISNFQNNKFVSSTSVTLSWKFSF